MSGDLDDQRTGTRCSAFVKNGQERKKSGISEKGSKGFQGEHRNKTMQAEYRRMKAENKESKTLGKSEWSRRSGGKGGPWKGEPNKHRRFGGEVGSVIGKKNSK